MLLNLLGQMSSNGANERRDLSFVRPVSRERAFEEVLRQFDAAIAVGQLEPGDRLPRERDLAAQFGVSRTSVREAIRVLEALGIIEVRRGRDNGATILAEPANAFSRLLRLHIGLQHVSVDDLIEFRVATESWAAAAFARKRYAETLAELNEVVERMASVSQADFNEIDTAFHFLLVRGAQNQMAVLVLDGARDAISRTILDAIMSIKNWLSERDRLVAEHRAIAAAIEAGDPDRAAALVAEHIRGFWRGYLHRSTRS